MSEVGKPGDDGRVGISLEDSEGDPDDCEIDREGGGDKEYDDEFACGEEECGEEDRACNEPLLEEDNFFNLRVGLFPRLTPLPSLRLLDRFKPSSVDRLSDSADNAPLSSGYRGARSL